MQPLASTSQRRGHASRFALELRAVLRARGVSKIRLCDAIQVPRSNLGYYLAGRNLPTIETAKRIADALDAPKLLDIVIAGRTVRCGRQGCPRSFLYEGGKPKVYCSEDCAKLAMKMRAGGGSADDGGRVFLEVVKGELDRVHGTGQSMRRKVLAAAADEFARSGSKRHRRLNTVQRRIDAYAVAVDEMCHGCEPEGLCRTADCPLRAFSPLPLAGTYTEERPTGRIRAAEGAWGPNNRPRMLEVIRAANAERWSRPGERERQSEASLARAAARTPEERAALGERISAGRRRTSA